MMTGSLAGLTAAEICDHRAPEPRLVKAAHQFESMMLKELLAPMARSTSLMPDGDSGEGGVLGEFASESLANGLSAGGGLGIAERVIHSLSDSCNSSEPKQKRNAGTSTNK